MPAALSASFDNVSAAFMNTPSVAADIMPTRKSSMPFLESQRPLTATGDPPHSNQKRDARSERNAQGGGTVRCRVNSRHATKRKRHKQADDSGDQIYFHLDALRLGQMQ